MNQLSELSEAMAERFSSIDYWSHVGHSKGWTGTTPQSWRQSDSKLGVDLSTNVCSQEIWATTLTASSWPITACR
jgi:hypothetical protein